MKATILLLVVLVSGLTVSAKTNPVIDEGCAVTAKKTSGFGAFHAHRKQNGVALAWTNSSAGVVNYVIQHSFDGYSFNPIGQVTPESTGWNNHEDHAALPGFNYYRIGAVLSDGSIEYSEVKMVRIVRRK